MGSGAEASHAKHVYCVDGSQTFRHVLKAAFEWRNFTTSVQGYSADVFDQISSTHPDVIIVDLAFGQDNGWRLLGRLAVGLTENTPIIVTSTDRRILESVRLEQTDSTSSRAYFAKPFDMGVLVETATQFADGARESNH
jgi:DNA-binding response OmpR family regulator